jgi:hypothetical protein
MRFCFRTRSHCLLDDPVLDPHCLLDDPVLDPHCLLDDPVLVAGSDRNRRHFQTDFTGQITISEVDKCPPSGGCASRCALQACHPLTAHMPACSVVAPLGVLSKRATLSPHTFVKCRRSMPPLSAQGCWSQRSRCGFVISLTHLHG